MRLNSDGLRNLRNQKVQPRLRKAAASALVIGGLALVFVLDRSIESAPVQHLYYLPIVFAAIALGRWASPIAAVAAVILYHLANPVLFTGHYKESDLVQIGLFLAVGFASARFVHDARRLARLAITDDLTGLYNLRGFESRLEACVGASRLANAPMSLLVLDVDRLKSLNDTHGHLTGGDAVRAVGHILADHLRDTAIACRFGGDEFVVALPGLGAEEATETAEELRGAVYASSPILGGKRFPGGTLSISIGLASLPGIATASSGTWPEGDLDAGEALFRAADQALYAAKSAGRNRVCHP